MNAQTLLSLLYKQGAVLAVADGKLSIDAPDGVLDAALVAQLREHKPAIVALLAALDGAPASVPAPQRRERGPAYDAPASLAQQRMLFLEELAGNSSYYNMPVAYRIRGALDKDALAAALTALAAAHDVLRTTYRLDGQAYCQHVAAPAALALREIDLAAAPEQAGALDAALQREAGHGFDLAHEWPLRAALIALGGGEHVLSINIHHIAADGWSARRIAADLGAFYAAALRGEGAAAGPRPLQYADFADWQQRWLDSTHYRDELAYWLGQLAGVPQLHSLPTDFVRPSVQGTAGACWSHVLPEALVARVEAAARGYRTTAFVLYQCVFAALLARYSGERDIVFGTASANRQPADFADTVGLFVNTLALRYAVDDALSFDQLVGHGMQVSEAAFRHRQLPFDVLVDHLQPARSLGFTPLVQVMLVMQENDAAALALENVNVTSLPQRQAVSKFDLALHLHAGREGVTCHWEYSSALFLPATIAALGEHFTRLLDACLAQPGQAIGTIALVDAAPPAATAGPDPVCVHRLFEAHAAATPDAVAVRDGAVALSYAQLERRAEALASHLFRACGGVPGRVGVCMEKSADLIVAMLAIFKVGAVYVPLDPHYPQERRDFMVRDCGMQALLLGRDEAPPAALPAGVALLDAAALSLEGTGEGYRADLADPALPAYIIYTSGSTGKPKGVLVSHSNLCYSLRANQARMAFGAADAMPTIGSQAFGASLLEILLPLISGGAVLVVRKAQVADLDLLIAATQDATVLHAVPSLMQPWLARVSAGAAPGYPTLRLLLVGGESVPARLLASLGQWRPSLRLLALYGMTETAIVCASYEPQAGACAHYSIGRPYPHASFHVLNGQGQRQPTGVPGELHIGGLAVALGYVGQPQLTAERFIDSALAGERLYRTGDRVRLLADGNYEFLGRVDHQVSLRGARIEMGEIETLARAVAGVAQAVASVASLGAHEETLVLYYTADAGADATLLGDAIRAHLARSLPDYMRPSLIEHLDALPLNPNGKVDRKRLPQPSRAAAPAAPATPTEQRIADIWHTLLGGEAVSVTANFFEVGGHSLMAARMVTQIRSSFGISFPLATLFASPTIRACAALVERALEDQYAQALTSKGGSPAAFEEELIL